MQDVIDDKVIDRIRKLLALAENNNSEAEATVAMERAHRLLARYNLTIQGLPKDKLDKQDPYVRIDERYGAMKGPVAGRVIASSIAKLYFCKMFYVHYTNRGDEYSFVGRKTNAEMAQMVTRHVISTLYGQAQMNKTIPGYMTNFMIGASNRIYARCAALIKEAEDGKLVEEAVEQGIPVVKNLPALRATYKMELENAEAFLEGEGVKMSKMRNSRGSRGGRDHYSGSNVTNGYSDGSAAGSKVSLRPNLSKPNAAIGGSS